MSDADLLRRILGAMRPDIPMDWHDQAWLAAKGLVTLEAIEADAAGVTLAATPAPLSPIVITVCPHSVDTRFTHCLLCERATPAAYAEETP